MCQPIHPWHVKYIQGGKASCAHFCTGARCPPSGCVRARASGQERALPEYKKSSAAVKGSNAGVRVCVRR